MVQGDNSALFYIKQRLGLYTKYSNFFQGRQKKNIIEEELLHWCMTISLLTTCTTNINITVTLVSFQSTIWTQVTKFVNKKIRQYFYLFRITWSYLQRFSYGGKIFHLGEKIETVISFRRKLLSNITFCQK